MTGAPDFGFPKLLLCGDAGHIDHKAWIYPIVAGRYAFAAVGADLGPALRVLGSLTACEQIENASHNRRRISRASAQIDPGGLNHWAGRNAFAAARAGIENVFDPAVQGLDKRQSAGLVHYRDFSNARAAIGVIVKPSPKSGSQSRQ